MPADLFGSNTKLEQFYVTGNKLTSLPENLLEKMTNLRIFEVSNNFLSELSPNLLKNAQNLERVNIANNSFVDQETVKNALNGLTNLRNLYLHDNNFENFDFALFGQFQKLVELYIGSLKGPLLTSISWQSLPSSLTSLMVDGIGEDLPETSFSNLVNLRSLTLSGSGIENLHKDTFMAQSDLVELYIENTNIKVLHSELFTSQINLRTISLSNNKIEELPAGIFAPLINLGIGSAFQGIRMNYNNIQRLNANSFGQHPHMQSISFISNKINEIERGIFSHFHPNMTTANFWSNVCIDRSFTFVTNLDEDENLLWCFNNWAGITTTTTTTSTSTQVPPTTTPGAAGRNFKGFEVFVILIVGFLGFLMNF